MRPTSLAFTPLVFIAALAFAAPAARPAAGVPTGKLPDGATPLHYSLHFTIDPHAERFEGEATIRIRLDRPTDRIWLHGQGLEVAKAEAIEADGTHAPAHYAERDATGVAEIRFDRALRAQTIELALAYAAPFNRQLEGLYKVTVGSDPYVVTQMEAVSARRAFPGFDEPRFKTTFDVTLTVPSGEVAVANTMQTAESRSADGKWKTLSFATTKPLPAYLIAVAVGPWDVVEGPPLAANAVRKTAVPLRAIAPRGNGPRLKFVLEQTGAIVRYYEDYTNQPYPFDKLDLLGAPDFAAGAMENAGLIIFRDSLLLLDAQSPAERFRADFTVNAHEIAHQWFGDLVTMPWWNDTWLNEAFATWAEGKATATLKPEYLADLEHLERRLDAMANDSLTSARRVRQPVNDRGEIENAFDGITYQKGSSVLAMFEAWLGEERFRRGMRAYLADHAFGSGSADDLIASIAQASDRPEVVAKAMRSFIEQAGVPRVEASVECRDGRATIALALAQSRYLPFGATSAEKTSWGVPVCARFGGDGTSRTQCFLLDAPKKTFDVAGACPAWVLPNADARGYYRFALPPDALAALTAQLPSLAPTEQVIVADAISSGFRRGDLAPAAVLAAMPALARGDTPQVATALFEDFRAIRENFATPAQRAALDQWARALYAPRMAALRFRSRDGEAGATIALRDRIAEFLGITLRDPDTRRALLEQGRAALGLDGSGSVDLGRADPNLLRSALKVAVQDDGERAFARVKAELATNHDTTRRYALVAALGATREPKLAAAARDFGVDPSLQLGEVRFLYTAQMAEPENRAGMWRWLRANFAKYVERTPAHAQAEIPKTFAYRRCSDVEADEIETFFAPKQAALVGGDRGLKQAVEGIRQCAALRAHVANQPIVPPAVDVR